MDANISNLSLSDSNIFEKSNLLQRTPPNFVTQRAKHTENENEFLNDFKNEMKELIASQNDEIKKLASMLKDIKCSNSSIETSMTHLSSQNDELQKKIERLELQARKDKDYIVVLEDKLEDMQRESRKTHIEIKNVPRLPGETKEDLINMALKLSTAVDHKIEKCYLKDIYRIQPKGDKTKSGPIVLEFLSTIQKTDFLKMVKNFNIKHKDKLCARHLGHKQNEYSPIFVSEQLTARAALLHFLGRDLVKSNAYKYCWTAYGRIYVRKDDNSPIIMIKHETQVQNLIHQK